MNKEELHKRLTQSFKYLRSIGVIHTQSEFADAIGMRIGHLNNAMNGDETRLTKGLMKKIAATYSDYIHEDWLLTGEGQMEKIDQRSMKIHIPSDKAVVAAGFVGTAISSVQEGECELRPVMTPFSWYDFTITVSGDSMLPTLQNGDIIACEWLHGDVDFKSNKIYVLDTDGGAAVKRVSHNGSSLLCHSDNPEYPDFTIESIENVRIARVVGVVREL